MKMKTLNRNTARIAAGGLVLAFATMISPAAASAHGPAVASAGLPQVLISAEDTAPTAARASHAPTAARSSHAPDGIAVASPEPLPGAGGDGSASAAILARVEGEAITADAFESRYGEYLVKTGAADRAFLRWDVLETMVDERLMVIDSRRSGIEQTSDYREELEGVRAKLLIEGYLHTGVLDTVEVTERELEDAFVRINTTLSVRHLYARTVDRASVLHRRLLNGESFEELAAEIFADSALAASGGSLGEIAFDETDPDFEDAAFALAVGAISPPVRTMHGYSIIQVTDRFTTPILTESDFATRKQRLAAMVRRKKLIQARSHFARELPSSLDVRFHEAAFERLLGQITGHSVARDEVSFDEFLDQPLVSFGQAGARTMWSVGDFRDHAAETGVRQRARVRSAADLEDFISGLAVRSELLRRAEDAGIEDHPAFSTALREAMDDWVLKWRKKEVAGNVRVPEDSIQAQRKRYPDEFLTSEGVPYSYDQARPLIAEQLRYLYTRRDTAELIERLRERYEFEIDSVNVFRVNIAGSHNRDDSAGDRRVH